MIIISTVTIIVVCAQPLKTVWVMPVGRIAHCEGPRPSFACPYIRVSFASATNEDLVEGIKRLANVIKRFQQETLTGSVSSLNTPDGNGCAVGSSAHQQPFANSNSKANAPYSNGNAVSSIGNSHCNSHLHTALSSGANGNGHHAANGDTGRSVQQLVDDNEHMGLSSAVRSAADTQPEAC